VVTASRSCAAGMPGTPPGRYGALLGKGGATVVPAAESFGIAETARHIGVRDNPLRVWLRDGVLTASVPGHSANPNHRRRFLPREVAAAYVVARGRKLGIATAHLAVTARWVVTRRLPLGWRG